MKTSSKILVYILSLLQIILSFMLGVFGNKLSELVKVDEQTLFWGILITIVLLLIVTVILLNYQKGETLFLQKSGILTTGNFLTSSIITTFPFAVVLGAIIQFIPIILLRPEPFYLYPTNLILANYEIPSALIAIFPLFIFRALRHDVVLMVLFCFGFAAGISGTLLLLRPYDHSYLVTLIGWNIYLLVVAFVSKSEKVRRYLSTTYQTLTQERK